ncbi:MAG: protease HtpX [Verrucomicrobiia bacterium]
MKIFNIAKRVLLFIVVNILVVTTIGLVLGLLGIQNKLPQGMYSNLLLFCLVWGMVGAFISLALSRIMAKWMMGVHVIPPDVRDPALRELVQIVHSTARKAGLETMPEVGIYESEEINAFATGPTRSRSLVAVSMGLLQNLRRDEIEGVIAHEVAHITNGDMVTMTLIQGVINAFVMFLARVLAFVLTRAMSRSDDDRGGGALYFLFVMLFQFALSLFGAIVVCWFSRWREFRADAGGAELAGRYNMINALEALRRFYEKNLEVQPSTSNEAAFQAFKISGKQSGFMRLFATHPPLEERIERLKRGE